MALCCIGGVCIPYSALVPLIVWGLRWLVEKLASLGLLPKAIETYLLTTLQIQPKPKSDCCNSEKSVSVKSGNVSIVQSVEEWTQTMKGNKWVVAKFSASWCKPCKTIQPIYESLATQNSKAMFITVDADTLDEVASDYKVAILPTFIVFHNSVAVGRYTGSDEKKLKSLISEHVQANE
jgi:thiol-disulfide isomerase/thioredoxin